MKKRILLWTVAAVMSLVTALCVPAQEAADAPAEEGGLLSSLLSSSGEVIGMIEDSGILDEVLPEGMDLDNMISIAESQLGQADSELSAVLGEIASKVEEEVGSGKYDELINEAASLISGLLLGGEEGFDMAGLDEYLEKFANAKETMKAYVLEKNTGMEGDVQIVSLSIIDSEGFDVNPTRTLVYCSQTNYTEDEQHRLSLTSAATDIILFTLQEEDGTYVIEDAQLTEDGEGYAASLEALAEQIGTTMADVDESLTYDEVFVMSDLISYLDEHPEYTALEYQGQFMTAEELQQYEENRLDELFPAESVEEETESITEG